MKKKPDAWDLAEHYLSPVKELFELEGVTDICVNRHDEIYIERHGEFSRVENKFPDEAHVATMVNQIANALAQVSSSRTHPILDARLKDGTRVCASLFPVSTRGTSLSFRLFPKKRLNAKDLIENGSLTKDMLEFFKMAIICRFNMLISGGTGSGKTTLLNIVSDFIPEGDRVITVEDTRELKISSANRVNLEAPARRQKEGAQVVDMSMLIRTCLRMNPTRIIVGEIRDAGAATAFLHAINTGHTSCSTIHANCPEDALERVQTLVAGHGRLPFEVVKAQVRSNLDLLVHAEKTPSQGRKITSVSEIRDGKAYEIYRWSYREERHIKTNAKSRISERFEKYGIKK